MKKLMALASMVAAVAVMAVPTVASAEFNDAGVPVEKITLDLKGSASFSGGTSCANAEASVTQTSATTGNVTKFEVPNPAECVVTGTLAALGCTELTSATAEGLPWVAHTDTSVLTITGVNIKNTYKGGFFCPKTVTISGEVTATPNNTAAVSTVALSGTLTSSLGTNVTVAGTQEVQGTAKGTYGI